MRRWPLHSPVHPQRQRRLRQRRRLRQQLHRRWRHHRLLRPTFALSAPRCAPFSQMQNLTPDSPCKQRRHRNCVELCDGCFACNESETCSSRPNTLGVRDPSDNMFRIESDCRASCPRKRMCGCTALRATVTLKLSAMWCPTYTDADNVTRRWCYKRLNARTFVVYCDRALSLQQHPIGVLKDDCFAGDVVSLHKRDVSLCFQISVVHILTIEFAAQCTSSCLQTTSLQRTEVVRQTTDGLGTEYATLANHASWDFEIRSLQATSSKEPVAPVFLDAKIETFHITVTTTSFLATTKTLNSWLRRCEPYSLFRSWRLGIW